MVIDFALKEHWHTSLNLSQSDRVSSAMEHRLRCMTKRYSFVPGLLGWPLTMAGLECLWSQRLRWWNRSSRHDAGRETERRHHKAEQRRQEGGAARRQAEGKRKTIRRRESCFCGSCCFNLSQVICQMILSGDAKSVWVGEKPGSRKLEPYQTCTQHKQTHCHK